MRYQLLIFDFDGTLADSFQSVMQSINVLAARHRLNPLPEESWDQLRRSHARNVLASLRAPVWKLPSLAREMKELIGADAHKVRLFPGMERTLQRLVKDGFRLAIATSNSRANVIRVLGSELAGLFEFYQCDIPIFGKARHLSRIIKKSGVPREAAIYVGDEIRDLEAARKAGIAGGAVAWGYTCLETLQAHTPDQVFVKVQDFTRNLGQRVA